tara:strand:+ start:159 stop:461 length:303 start_codon:yes stop_codon:yes gene_type:complete
VDALAQKIVTATDGGALPWAEGRRNVFRASAGGYEIRIAVIPDDVITMIVRAAGAEQPFADYFFDSAGGADYTTMVELVATIRADDTTEGHTARLSSLLE